VGHSLGGLLARAVAVQRPDLVQQVITMGAPFRDIRAHPLVLAVADLVRFGVIMPRRARAEVEDLCFTDECGCAFARSVLDEEFPASVAHWSIYSRNDGVVDWRSCVEDDDRHNIEVGATHVGMAFSRAVYEWLGDLLAGASPASMSA
jgi:pimeloyl-ACP methyl ester carboxylesterase